MPQIAPNVPRTGRIAARVRRAFIANPGRALSTTEIRRYTHPRHVLTGRNGASVRHWQHKSIRRVCKRLCRCVGRSDSELGKPMLWRLKD
jgi:hypothetical protein